jgi:tetratricopeptide (TPR) repeat protein
MAARVEARLKEHADQLFEEATAEIPETEDEEIVAGSSMIGEKRASGLGRILLILFVGILLGIGLHYFLNNFSVTGVAQQEQEIKELQTPVDLDRGLQLWEKKDFNGAEAEFKRIISLHPEDPRAYNNLAAFYAAQGNYEQARDYLEQALATDKAYETIYHNLGAVYAEMARGSYGRALRLAKTNQIVSLPVFSGQGVVSVEPSTRSDSVIQVVDNTVKMPEETADKSKIVVESGTAESIGNVAASTTPAATSESSDEETTVVSAVNATATHGGEDMTGQGSGSVAEQEVVMKQESLQDFLRRWAQAWSDQDVSAYLSFYGENFVPPGGRTRQVWETQRQQRLTHPKSIEVTLDSFQLLEQDDIHVKVEVIQGYKSDVLSDKTRKVFDLQRDGNSWKILRERSLGAVR